MSNPIERYLNAHEVMIKTGRPIPPKYLTAYQNAMREIQRTANGLHNKVIVITNKSSVKNMMLFRTESVRENKIDLEVRS
jgi:hypothetical protein